MTSDLLILCYQEPMTASRLYATTPLTTTEWRCLLLLLVPTWVLRADNGDDDGVASEWQVSGCMVLNIYTLKYHLNRTVSPLF